MQTLVLMAILAVLTLAVGAVLLSAEITVAGWITLVVGLLAVLVTLGQATKS